MTRQKSFKTRVRTRMDKTGESYTTARRQLLAKTDGPAVDDRPATGPQPDADPIKAIRLPDTAVRERTGRGWDEWFSLLDGWGATTRTHTEIARWLVEEQQVDGWWAQSVTVTYEQVRGLRAPGQRSDGFFTVSASKTVAVSADRLFEAFADEQLREQWLPGAGLRVRTATAPKSFRADWTDGASRIVVGFNTRGDAKAQVWLSHEKIADAESAAGLKAFWRDRLAVLARLMEGQR